MAQATCSVDDCLRPARARGWCAKHYQQWNRTGEPVPDGRTLPLEVRIQRHIERLADGCWDWTGAKNTNGYGRIQVDGKTAYAHRASYEHYVGPIPDGLHLDHLCRNRSCVNPAHLEPVTCRENIHRGQGNSSKTHCPQGHPYSGWNLAIVNGRRICVTCRRERVRIANRKARERQRNAA